MSSHMAPFTSTLWLRLSYLFLEEIKQAKIVEFGKAIRDRTLKHIKSFANICDWVRLRSPLKKLEKMIVKAIALESQA